ncbi:molybdopterin-guanine dinucleotide biosynthesis protein [Cryobacterium sp. TMT1-2-2]|uniref:molybdenum cofactor guanylyltransferase n=1 Tax=Cryobacterium sp. TMT1-2-2 TaxID=1259233 RepID=UPI00106CA5C4|nr:NTP transferase domain-containing protein [Cryobacterium sp. TMT1-2-2]TFD13457.1 molybdopterin-guanine dinucleotide biosynthesis protein [Cryobacterium sp. TMT1-2-2]
MTVQPDLIVLAGGRGTRLGGAFKPAVEVAGRTLLSRVLDARPLARHTIVVGPPSARAAATQTPTAPTPDSAIIWALEDPPYGGPVAGIAAGLAAQGAQGEQHFDEPADWLLVLACDLPRGADAARLLVAAASAFESIGEQCDGVHLIDSSGHAQWLAGIYRGTALRAAVASLGDRVDGASMRQLLAGLKLKGLLDESGAGIDVDTWQDVERSSARLTEIQPNPRSDPQ